MTTQQAPPLAVALLERAVGFTRGTLATVRPEHLGRETPCTRWRLGDLLDHLADALDAFLEASGGLVGSAPTGLPYDPVAAADPAEVLRQQAGTLLGAWSSPAASTVRLGAAALPAGVLLATASLEIAVHGWDVAQATGDRRPLPEALAADLLPLAHTLVAEADRGVRFAPVVDVEPGAPASARLLGFCGRQPLPSLTSHPQPGK